MFSKPFAAGLLVIACVTAAAGGAYVAVRHDGPNGQRPAATTPAVSAAAEAAETAPVAVVQETEALVPAARATSAETVESPRSRPAAPAEPAGVPVASRARASRTARDRRVEPSRTPASAPAAEARAVEAANAPSPSVASEPVRTNPEPVPAADPAPAEAAPRDPPAPVYEELVVPSSAVVGLRVETPVSSEDARIEDRVQARVTRDVMADGRVAIPAGTRAIGSVTLVDRGGKLRERARLGVRFHTLVLADGTELPVRTEAILREGESPAGESSRKIGGAAVGGAILGAIINGKKGAIVGGATGAAGGTAVVMAGDRNAATLPVGAVVTVRLSAPFSVAVEKQ
jgi:hypothetical protein